MNIKELLKSEEYKLLLINAKEKQAEFYAFEEKETIKRDNLEKHKKILSALETESDDIEQQLKNIDITDNSVSIDDNFREFPKLCVTAYNPLTGE